MTWPQYVPPACAHPTIELQMRGPYCVDCRTVVSEQTYETYDPSRSRTTLDDVADLFGETFVSASGLRRLVASLGITMAEWQDRFAAETLNARPQRFSPGGLQ